MFSISKEELDSFEIYAYEGDVILHMHDSGIEEEVILKYGQTVNSDGTKEKSNQVGFYKLKNGKVYIATIDNRLIGKNVRLKK